MKQIATCLDPASGQRPTHTLWIVSDGEDGKPKWTEIMSLWPTRKGTGYSGKLTRHISASGGRLVILPTTVSKKPEVVQ